MLVSAIAAAVMMGQTLIVKFWKKDVYISTETRVTNNNTFPAVTFCLNPIAEGQLFCGLKANDALQGKFSPDVLSCNKYGWWNFLMPLLTKNTMTSFVSVGQATLMTTPFNTFAIGCPIKSNGCVLDYLLPPEKYFQPLNNSFECVTWNYDGNFSNLKNRMELSLSEDKNFFRGENVVVYVHDHRESPFSVERYFPLNSKSDTQIFIRKSLRKRIKRHPPNDCEDVYYSNKKNIFPGRYTIEACMDTFTCIQSLIECGEVLDFCRLHIPVDLLDRYWKVNQSIVEVHRCMYLGFKKGLFNTNGTECLTPCEKEFYPISFVTIPGDMKISLFFEERNVFEYSEEKFVYLWHDVVAGVGGLIGLFCGLSILSIIEVFTYLWLWFVSLFCKGNKESELQLENIPGSSVNDIII